MAEKEKLSTMQQKLDKKIKQYMLGIEANVVSTFYKNPKLLHEFPLVSLDNFKSNMWKVYFAIIQNIVIKQNKENVDSVVIDFFLLQHTKLKEKFEEFGGYEAIEKTYSYIDEKNIYGYVEELNKWNSVYELNMLGFDVSKRLSDYADMNSSEVYAELEASMNNIFLKNIDGLTKSYDIAHNIDDLYNELDNGQLIGLPYLGLPKLTTETGGCLEGNITLIGGISNAGKSSFFRNAYITQLIEQKEHCVIILNEEDLRKFQSELIIYYINNKTDRSMTKNTLRQGGFDEYKKENIKKAISWIKNLSKDKIITIVPLLNYQTDTVVRLINKYSGLGVKHFVLDTFKMDSGRVSAQSRLEMQQSMVKLYDTIKPANRNVHLLCTFQLNKSSSRQRFYTQDNIGECKSIVDVASSCIMIRNLFDDEKVGGTKEMVVFNYDTDSDGVVREVPVRLDVSKNYQVVFITKTRGGSTQKQIVIEHDLARNIVKEIGYTRVSFD